MALDFPKCPVCREPADHIVGKETYPHDRWRQLLFLVEEGVASVTKVSAPGTRCFICDVVSRTGKLNQITIGRGKKRLLGDECLKHLDALRMHYAGHSQ